MNSRPKQPKYARNKNILVIGGSGSGKTRFFVKPSLMQCTSKDFPTSYIVTDPKGTLILETGKMLQRYKYRIKVLNTINFKKSMKYNPFAYLRSEKDILKLVNTIIANTKGDGEKSGEDFWVKAEKLYYTALIGYIWYEAPEDEKNFTTLLEMINASEAREDDEDFKNPVDLMFERLEEKDPEHFAVKQYKKYKLAAGVAQSCFLLRKCTFMRSPSKKRLVQQAACYDLRDFVFCPHISRAGLAGQLQSRRQFSCLEVTGGEADAVQNPCRRGRDARLCGDNIRAHQRSGGLQGVREGFRRNGGFLNRGLESSFIGNRNAERGFRQNGIPEAMRRIGGKASQCLIGQGFFQRFAVFIRGDMPHDDTQTGVFPLRLKRFLNAAVRAFEV